MTLCDPEDTLSKHERLACRISGRPDVHAADVVGTGPEPVTEVVCEPDQGAVPFEVLRQVVDLGLSVGAVDPQGPALVVEIR